MEVLLQNLQNIQLNEVIMWAIGGILIYLAIAKQMEPTLLQPPIIKLCTTKEERRIKMHYKGKPVSKLTKIDAHDHNMNAHQFLRRMKQGNPAFFEKLDDYSRKYQLPEMV